MSGATVTGDFSGTWSESGTAVTDAQGVASFTTSSTAKGNVTVNFCVSSVTGTALTLGLAGNEAVGAGRSDRRATRRSRVGDRAVAPAERQKRRRS